MIACRNRCLVEGCHDGVGRLVIDMVNVARLAVPACELKWMASFVRVTSSFGMKSFLSKLVIMMTMTLMIMTM